MSKDDNVILSFVVRPNVYTKNVEPVMKKYIWVYAEKKEGFEPPEGLDVNKYLKLDTTQIFDYVEDMWSDSYGFQGGTQPAIKAVYKKLLSDGSGYEYRYYDPEAETDKWRPYEFRITFPFTHEDTIGLAPKQYKYELTLYAGPTLTIVGDEKKSLQNFNYKEILQSHTDFIVEGTLSE